MNTPPQAIKDPYAGLHAESVQSVWHDPTSYDHLKHGPPYLPENTIKVTASDRRMVKATVRPLVERTSADSITTILTIIEHIKADFGPAPMSELAVLVAFLRAESIVHKAHHWQTRGENYYGDHLLFDRIVGDAAESIDPIAERMVGSGHIILAHPVLHAKHVSAVVQSFYEGAPVSPNPNEYALISLRAVLRTLVAIKVLYATLEQQGLLSLGTDNLVQGVADKHEEFVYLLKQRTASRTASYNRSATTEVGMEFPSLDALKKYLHLHPKADPANHSVKEEDKDEDLGAGEWQPAEQSESGGWVSKPEEDPAYWDKPAAQKVASTDPRWKTK